MAFTVGKRMPLGFLFILLLSAIPMLVVYRGLLRVQREMRHLAEVTEPLQSATHEMEINIKGIAIGTLGYLSTPSSVLRDLVANNEEDFEGFHAEYLSLSVTDEERSFGEVIGRLYGRFKDESRELKARRDRQAEAMADALGGLEEIDRLFDQKLPAALSRRNARDAEKLRSISTIDEGIDAIRLRVALYRWTKGAGHRAVIERQASECRDVFGRVHELDWTAEQSADLERARIAFEGAMARAQEVLVLEDEFRPALARFIALREEIDDLLDEGIQPLAKDLLHGPRRRAEGATVSVLIQIGWILPLFALAAALTSLLLTRSIIRPLQSLLRGTAAVSRGDLSCRVSIRGNDEFGVLGRAFNHMVAHLQETLVSKGALEKSEKDLHRTVHALQQEFSERLRAESEQDRLRTSLRRAETLSALGTLVAGVAHQVRNPLFGICSILEAMEARLGDREEYREYLERIRDPADRLKALMRELMEYGRSGNVEFGPGSVVEPIHEALASCREAAETAMVTVETRLDEGLPEARIDSLRLGRAFENLLENAIQHSPPGGVVTVTAEGMKDEIGTAWMEVRVEDRGPGFRMEDLPRVFEPFFTRRRGGMGLGLALVERIIESHGGQVTVADRPGGGASVTVRLPVEFSGARASSGLAAERQA